MSSWSKPRSYLTGADVRQARLAAGLTLRGAARAAGVVRSHLLAIESGRAPLTAAMHARLADTLGLPPIDDDHTPVVVAEAEHLLSCGESAHHVAYRLGITYHALHAALRRHGSRWLPYCPEERGERAS